MKAISIVLAILISSSFSQSVSRVSTTSNGTILPQGIRWQALSSNGVSHNFPTSISQISGSNPAALSNFKAMAIGLSYQYDTNIKEAYIADFGYEHSYIGIPQSFVFIYPFNKRFIAGISASQKYNSVLDFGEMKVRTVENPEGTGEIISAKRQTNIYSFSALVAYNFSDLFQGVSVAFRYNFDGFWISDKFWRSVYEANNYSSTFALGLGYKAKTDLGEVKFATYYEKGIDINGMLKYKGEPLLVAVDIDPAKDGNFGESIPALDQESFEAIVLLPNRWHAGFNLITEYGNLLADFTLIDWESTGAFKNTIEFSSSYGFQFSEDILLSLGVYSTDRRVIKEDFYYKLNNFNALFITFGARTTFLGLNIDLAVADSHLASDSWREQTVFKIAVGKSF